MTNDYSYTWRNKPACFTARAVMYLGTEGTEIGITITELSDATPAFQGEKLHTTYAAAEEAVQELLLEAKEL